MTNATEQEKQLTSEKKEDDASETFFSYYIKQRSMWISIFISLFILLDIIALFLTTSYTISQVFLYLGILLILIGGVATFFIILEKNYFYGVLGAIIFGLATMIEIIIHISTAIIYTTDIPIVVISLMISGLFIIAPVIGIYIFTRVMERKKS
ncbi:MAG: hypothetical protein FK734_16470 [Asgard group archaeon]|nr:hypothetical protein [Asgard group archaeon]